MTLLVLMAGDAFIQGMSFLIVFLAAFTDVYQNSELAPLHSRCSFDTHLALSFVFPRFTNTNLSILKVEHRHHDECLHGTYRLDARAFSFVQPYPQQQQPTSTSLAACLTGPCHACPGLTPSRSTHVETCPFHDALLPPPLSLSTYVYT